MDWRFQVAIFDMDGTLFGTERLAVDALREAFAEQGIALPARALEFVIGLSGKETRAHLAQFVPANLSVDPILRRGGELILARIEREGMPIKPGAVEFLEFLRQRGTTMGLATSTRKATTMDNLRRAKLTDYFSAVVGGDQVECAKPAPDIYLRVLRELCATPEQAIAIEDSDHGIRSAHAAGLRVIHVPDIKAIDPAIRALAWREYPTMKELHAAIASDA